MKKYNLSAIMKRAWTIKKQNSKNIFGECLKMAWDEAKEINLIFVIDKGEYGKYEVTVKENMSVTVNGMKATLEGKSTKIRFEAPMIVKGQKVLGLSLTSAETALINKFYNKSMERATVVDTFKEFGQDRYGNFIQTTVHVLSNGFRRSTVHCAC